MSVQRTSSLRRWWRNATFALLAALASCAQPPSTSAASIPPIPAGDARIWFYRDYEPYVTLARPYARLNGRIVGISEPGGAFYSDVPAGTYKATVDSDGFDVNQFVTVSLAAGQTVYVKVQALRDWASGGGVNGYYQRDTFYTRLIPPPVGAAAVARTPYYPSGS